MARFTDWWCRDCASGGSRIGRSAAMEAAKGHAKRTGHTAGIGAPGSTKFEKTTNTARKEKA